MTKLKHNLALIGVALFVLIGVVVAVLIASPRNVTSGPVGQAAGTQEYSQVDSLKLPLIQLEGDWQYKKNDLAFTAKVVGQDIKIEWVTTEGTSATYWHGTFKTSESPGHTINSIKTEDASEIVLSQSANKDFLINDDSIAFDFKAMGFTTKIVLSR